MTPGTKLGPYARPLGKRYSRWDVTADGQRLLIMRSEGVDETAEAAPAQINIVLNWFEELKQQVPVK